MLSLLMLAMITSCSNVTAISGIQTASKVNFKYYNTGNLDENLSDTDKSILSTYRKVAEDDLLTLYVDDHTSYIALEDKRSGKVWYAVPPAIEQDTQANDNSRPISMSTLSITYIQNQSSKSMDNYTNSIINSNFKILNIGGGIEVDYTVADPTLTLNDIPQKISDVRYKKFFVNNANLTDVDKIRTGKYYKYNAEGKYWEFVGDETRVVYMADIMERVNYTEDDLIKDNIQFGIVTNSTRVFFKVPMQFYLQNESLIVDVPLKRISYNSKSPPLELNVLQNFGMAKNTDGGYLFVPDGSGALIDFSGQQTKTGTYKTRIYGDDMTIPVKNETQTDYKACMPVFGMKAGNSAFLAIIEDSDALASVNAVRAGTMNSYNSVYSSFVLSETQNVSIGGSDANAVAVIQKSIYSGDIRVRYSFLAQADSDYSGMARYYRSFLQSQYTLKPDSNMKYRLNVELLGAVQKQKSFLGIRYNGIQKLTTFSQAENFLSRLKQQGVGAINLQYTGWMNNGLDQYSALKFNVIGALGGKSGMEDLNSFAKQNNTNLFYSVNALVVPQSGKYFSKYSNASKTLNNSIAEIYNYDIVTGQSTSSNYIVSLNYLGKLAYNIVKNSSLLKPGGIALGDLGSDLYSDFGTASKGNRQSALSAQSVALKKLNTALGGVMTDNANIYALPYESVVVNAPLTSNNFNVVDESIPFYTMVLHGLVEYTGAPLNYSQDIQTDILKLAETGAEPYFSLMYADGSSVKDTDYSFLYSNNANLWLGKASELYKKLDACLGAVQGKQIISHEQIAANVYRIRYEGDYTIYVNYNPNPVNVDHLTVSGDNFILVKGEKQ